MAQRTGVSLAQRSKGLESVMDGHCDNHRVTPAKFRRAAKCTFAEFWKHRFAAALCSDHLTFTACQSGRKFCEINFAATKLPSVIQATNICGCKKKKKTKSLFVCLFVCLSASFIP